MGQRNVIARLMVSVFLAGSIAVGAVLAQGDGPPAPRTFGPDTIAVMHEVGATALAVEAGKTLMLDKPELLLAANTQGICVVGLTRIS